MDINNLDKKVNKIDKKLDKAIEDINKFLEGIYENMIKVASRALKVEIEFIKSQRVIKGLRESSIRYQAQIERLEAEIKDINERVCKNELELGNQSKLRVRSTGYSRGRGYNLTYRGQYINRSQIRPNNRGHYYHRKNPQYTRDAFEESKENNERNKEKFSMRLKKKSVDNKDNISDIIEYQDTDDDSSNIEDNNNQSSSIDRHPVIRKLRNKTSILKEDVPLKKSYRARK